MTSRSDHHPLQRIPPSSIAVSSVMITVLVNVLMCPQKCYGCLEVGDKIFAASYM